MSIVTLTLKTRTTSYDLTKTKSTTQFKSIITRSIKEGKKGENDAIGRLHAARVQLLQSQNTSFVREQLQRIQKFLATVDSSANDTLQSKVIITTPAHKSHKKEEKFSSESLITDTYFFPRSEYYTRFQGTTAFAMNEPRAGSYLSVKIKTRIMRRFEEKTVSYLRKIICVSFEKSHLIKNSKKWKTKKSMQTTYWSCFNQSMILPCE